MWSFETAGSGFSHRLKSVAREKTRQIATGTNAPRFRLSLQFKNLKGKTFPIFFEVVFAHRVLRENDNVLVDFFAPWCPACVTFQPHLDRIQEATKDIPLKVIKVRVVSFYPPLFPFR